MNNFEFLRTILYSDSSEVILQAIKSLRNEGLEVYVKDSEKGFKLVEEQIDSDEDLLLVPAADWSVAKDILTGIGFEKYLTEPEVPAGVKSDLEEAKEKFFKKRKWTYIETAVIIVLAMLYYFFRIILH